MEKLGKHSQKVPIKRLIPLSRLSAKECFGMYEVFFKKPEREFTVKCVSDKATAYLMLARIKNQDVMNEISKEV